ADVNDQCFLGLCSYCMDGWSADAVVEVRRSHAFSLAKHHGRWNLIEMRRHGLESSAAGQLTRSVSKGRELRRVIENQLAIYMGAYPERIELKGGRVRLSEPQATK